MNIRKNVDYSEMYEALDNLMARDLPQMEQYYEIGKAVCQRSEKGAAVMASEYLNKKYPDAKGFSPRSLRRMRDFYRTYENQPICVVLDLYARKIVSHSIGLSNSTQLTKRALKSAYYERVPKAGLILHTDQGTNYTSSAFQKCAKELNITQSFSRASNPYDNSVMESFFKTLKLEELYRKDYRSERELKESIARYIRFYNSERLHSVNFYRSPDKYEEEYYTRHVNTHK